jgi:plasmid stabilization system protein ParE
VSLNLGQHQPSARQGPQPDTAPAAGLRQNSGTAPLRQALATIDRHVRGNLDNAHLGTPVQDLKVITAVQTPQGKLVRLARRDHDLARCVAVLHHGMCLPQTLGVNWMEGLADRAANGPRIHHRGDTIE